MDGKIRMREHPGGYASAEAGFMLRRDFDGKGAMIGHWRDIGRGGREKLSEGSDFQIEAGGQREIGVAPVQTSVTYRTLEGVIRLP